MANVGSQLDGRWRQRVERTGQDKMKEKIVTGAGWRCDERRAPRQAQGVLPRLDLRIVSRGRLRSGHGDDKGERVRRN